MTVELHGVYLSISPILLSMDVSRLLMPLPFSRSIVTNGTLKIMQNMVQWKESVTTTSELSMYANHSLGEGYKVHLLSGTSDELV